MFFFYSIVFTVGFIVLSPRFIFDAIFNGKYAAGFKQRLGFIPKFDAGGKQVVWLHCVSVGEVNAARPLAQQIRDEHPDHRLIVSTTTRTGQDLAKTAFADIADLIFYFPFDWRSTVRRALKRVSPSVVLLMETEIWFNFIREAYKSGARVAIVNGRLSERSFKRFAYIKGFMRRVMNYVEFALMQDKADAKRMMALGMRGNKVKVTGNLKFDHDLDEGETDLTGRLRDRFGITPDAPLVIAASTHSPEERWVLDAFKQIWKSSETDLPRLMIAPRHPERFAEVADLIRTTGFTWVRRSESESARDKVAEVILLDTIGELRAAYPLAELVFVGGSLIPHGGQSVFEPAAAARSIIVGPHTANFAAAVKEFTDKAAIFQLPQTSEAKVVETLAAAIGSLLSDGRKRRLLGSNAQAAMTANRGATRRTVEYLGPLLGESTPQ